MPTKRIAKSTKPAKKVAEGPSRKRAPARTKTALREQADGPSEVDVSGARPLFTKLRGKLAPAYEPSPKLRAYYEKLVERADAIHDGAGIGSDLVLVDAMQALSVIVPFLAKGNSVVGFGARETVYTLDLCLELEGAWRGLRVLEAEKSGTSKDKSLTFHDARTQRVLLHRTLAGVTPRRSPHRAALDKAASHGSKKARDVAAGLETLASSAAALFKASAKDEGLAEALADKGITVAFVNSAGARAQAIASAEQAHGEQGAAKQAAYDEVNLLDGRVMARLRALRDAVELARAGGVQLAEVTLAYMRSLHAHHTNEPAPAPTPGSPAAPGG